MTTPRRATMATIGVYGFDGESFLQRLHDADVRLLIDVRQRRGHDRAPPPTVTPATSQP